MLEITMIFSRFDFKWINTRILSKKFSLSLILAVVANISYAQPSNDCVFTATDITAQINAVNPYNNPFECAQYPYSSAGSQPTRSNVNGNATVCDPSVDYRDIWFSFTITSTSPGVWLTVFQNAGLTPDYVSAIYSGTPGGTCGATGSITGLSLVDCSDGLNEGGVLDMAYCSTPDHPRVNISGLAPGTYYLRIWEYGGGAPPNGMINLCVENASPVGITVDQCPPGPTMGTACGSAPNVNINETYTNLSNAGTIGNACNTSFNEPQWANNTAGQVSENCTGTWTLPIGFTNTAMNNSAIYSFTVNSGGTCQAAVSVQFDNIVYQGTSGNAMEVQVVTGTCGGSTSAIMSASTTSSCIDLRPSTPTVPNGTYYIIVDGEDGQLFKYDLTINITYSGLGCTPFTPPPAPVAVNGERCGAGTVNLSVNGCSGTVNWYASATGGGVIATGPSFTTPNLSSTTVYYATCTVSGCESARTPVAATVKPVPLVNVPANVTVCPGTAIPSSQFTSTPPGATFNWTNSNTQIGVGASGSGDVPSFTTANSTSGTITGNFQVAPTLNGCAGSASNYSVSVYPAPVAVVPSNMSICSGYSVTGFNFYTVPANSNSTFDWSNDNPAIGIGASGSGNFPTFTSTNSGTSPITGTISVTATTNSCVGQPSNFTITVKPKPTLNVPNDTIVCSGSVIPQGTPSSALPGTTYSWTNNNTSIGLSSSGNGNVPSFNAQNNTLVPVTANISITPASDGCAGTPSSYTITVEPNATVSVPANISVCAGGTVQAMGFTSNPPNATFEWTNSNTLIGLPAAGTGNISSFTATNSSSSAITSTITVTPILNGCAGTPSSFTITVSPYPVANVPASYSVCPGSAVPASTFTSTPAGASFIWNNSNTSIGLSASGNGNVPSFTSANNVSGGTISGTIEVTPILNGCAGLPSTYSISVTQSPVVTPVANVTACTNSVIGQTVFTSNPSGATFTWTNNNTSIGLGGSGNGDVPSFTAVNSTTSQTNATITVTPQLAGCVGVPYSYSITVNPAPSVVVPGGMIVCEGDIIQGTSFTSAPAGATYTWTNSNTAIGLQANGNGNIAPFIADNNTNTFISSTIEVTPTLNGCPGTPSSYSISVKPSPIVNVPSDFTVCSGQSVAATSFSSLPATSNINNFYWSINNTSVGLLSANGQGNVPSFTASNTTGSPVTATVSVSTTVNGCSSVSPSTYEITIDPAPIVDPVADITVCDGAVVPEIVLSGTPSGSSYFWTNNNTSIGLGANGSTVIPSFTAINGGSSAVIATISYYAVNNSCQSPNSTFTITVNYQGNTSFSYGSSTFCQTGSDPAPVVTGAQGGTFSAPSGLAINANTGIIDLENSSTGTYTITYSAPGSCPYSTYFTMTITNSQNATFNYPGGSYCQSETNPLPVFPAGASAGTFTATPAGLVFANNATGEINLSGSTPGTYTVTNSIPASGGCAASSFSTSISIKPSPLLSIPSNTNFCAGQQVPVQAFTSTTSGASISWTNDNTAIGLGVSGSGDISPFIASGNGSPETATITVSASSNGCTSSSSYLISVYQQETASISYSSSTYCQSAPNALPTVSGTIGGTFTSSPSGLQLNSNTGEINFGASSLGSYTVQYTTNGVCNTIASFNLTVSDDPNASFSYSGVSFCKNGPNPQPIFPAGSSAGTFTASPSGVQFVNSTGVIDLAASSPGTYTITNFIAAAGGCNSSTATATIQILQAPSASISASSSGICPGDSALVTITLSGTGPWSFNYVRNSIQYSVTNYAASTYSFYEEQASSYSLVSISDVNCSGSASGSVVLNNTSSPTAILTGNVDACAGSAAALTIQLTGTAPWSLSYSDGLGNTTVSNIQSSPHQVNVNNGGTYSLVSVSDASCAGSATGSSTVVYYPSPSVDSSDVTIIDADCKDTGGAIHGLRFTGGSAPYTYVWENSAGAVVSNGSIDLSDVSSGFYTIVATDLRGCEATYKASVNQGAGVIAEFTFTPESGQTPLPVLFTNQSTGATVYEWDFGNGGVSSSANPSTVYKEEGTFSITLIAKKANGCADTVSHELSVSDTMDIVIPNVFTPNNDGVNDVFTFSANGFGQFSCTIFNRWGATVYFWDTPNGGWDGKTSSGEDAGDGVYYYVLKLSDKEGKLLPEKTGTVSLIRANN